eukprot:186303-Pyramimonas_sp.AAC.2
MEVDEVEAEHKALFEKAKQKRKDDKDAEDDDDSPPKKRPAAAVPKKVATASVAAMKKPAASPKNAVKPCMPGPGVGVEYRGGKILASESKQGWRVWPNKAEVGHEKTVKFGGSKKASFAKAIELIDSF